MARRRSFGKTFQVFLAPSAARTASGQGTSTPSTDQAQVARLDVTAVAGTAPTLVVTVEESPNGSTGWTTHSSFQQMVTTGSQTIDLRKRSQPFMRASWVIGGTTPSFTFAVQVANSASALT